MISENTTLLRKNQQEKRSQGRIKVSRGRFQLPFALPHSCLIH